jgi:hypothetical protein
VLIPAVEAALTQHSKVRLYYQIDPNFSGIDSGAIWDDFKVGMEHLFRWERIALVTDVEWIRATVQAFRFVIPCEMKVFGVNEAAQAQGWIVEGLVGREMRLERVAARVFAQALTEIVRRLTGRRQHFL